jgi:hypothetical protein
LEPIGAAWEIGVSGGQAITGEGSGLHISNISGVLVDKHSDVGRKISTSGRVWEGVNFVVGAALLGYGAFGGGSGGGTPPSSGNPFAGLTAAEIDAAVNSTAKSDLMVTIEAAGDIKSGSCGVTAEGYYQNVLRFNASSSAPGAKPGTLVTTEMRAHSTPPNAAIDYPGGNSATGNVLIISQGGRRMLPNGVWTNQSQRVANPSLANDTHIPIHRN